MKKYEGNPEDLHAKAHDLGKKSTDNFVNPGTPDNGLVGENDRKTGVIGGAANARLRERLQPSANDAWATSKKSEK